MKKLSKHRGAMASVLSSFFSRDPKHQFGFDIPSVPTTVLHGVSIGETFKKAEPDEKATIFWAHAQDGGGVSLKQQAHKLKTMRHPNILTYVDSIELDGKFYLVTEPCVPLCKYFDNSHLTAEQREFIVSWGLYQVMSTLKFLHEANVSHENIRRAIYVTPAGDWKIAALDQSTAFTSPRNDLNQLALIVWEVFNGFRDEMAKPEPPGKMPKRLHELYKKMATPGAQRLTAGDLIKDCRLTGGFLKNRFVDTLLFLEEFQLKEAPEKQAFFTHLRDHLDIFPDDVAKYKILPKLILSYEYGDAGPNILIPLFKLGRLLDEQEYQRRIVPCLVKLFSSPDRTTRVKLLERIDEFSTHLTPQVVNEKIFTNLATGFMDTSPPVRESTVKAMVSLAEKLNTHNLNTELMKHLARLQGTDEHGGIRTNTTICLGKVGCFLEPSNRQRILIGAFTRGMKDPFPPARVAAVLALAATQQFYSLVEVANKVVPALGPLTCDPEKQVRDQAFKTLKGFLDKLEKASENPEIIPELEAQVKAGGKGIFGSDKVPQWASWALKSLSGKFYKSIPQPDGAQASAAGAPSKEGSPSPSVGSNSSSAPRPAPMAGMSALKPTPVPNKAENDGWGNLDEGEDLDDDWTDAKEPEGFHNNKPVKKDEDDWGTGWESEMSAPTPVIKAAAVPLKKPIGVKPKASGGGGLKLTSKPKVAQQAPEDDLDFLLGVTAQPKKTSEQPVRKTSAASTVSYVKEPSPVASGGWDDFEETPASGGWDDSGWEENSQKTLSPTPVPVATKPATSSTSLLGGGNKDREARRAELAAKNEQRKRELAEKRAQRGVQTKPLQSTVAPKTEASGDGWDDF